MHEFELIEHYFHRAGGAGVAVGIGDDGAVLDLPAERQLVAVADTLVAGVHYPDELTPADIGFRAVAVNLSDIAAMGATPAWFTLALSIPAADATWLEGFASGLFAAADEHDVALVGGDTTAGLQTVITVQALGHVARGRCLQRSGCQPGDRIYLSGTPGDAAAGLACLQNGESQPYLVQRFRRPAARVALGASLVGIANAAIDVSDGLCADLSHVLTASGCGATLEQERLPLSAELVAYCGEAEAARSALAGGDDYELVFTVSEANEQRLLQATRDKGQFVTRIGVAEPEPGLRMTHNGQQQAVPSTGYRHFA
ncbi:MAG: thiamine-phosphate kinase [Woeseia sp.]|nr:thiamine-phosphate kinase [Woeseia sp.]MBT8095528.1 thiamine-phosphate kinase [Woeseia sp.]NNE59864.1 thiamine-phosphate kinase [Woeseia sp.]NNL55853.1 thiamine-phosphate kinase [Woeseia sp.]